MEEATRTEMQGDAALLCKLANSMHKHETKSCERVLQKDESPSTSAAQEQQKWMHHFKNRARRKGLTRHTRKSLNTNGLLVSQLLIETPWVAIGRQTQKASGLDAIPRETVRAAGRLCTTHVSHLVRAVVQCAVALSERKRGVMVNVKETTDRLLQARI